MTYQHPKALAAFTPLVKARAKKLSNMCGYEDAVQELYLAASLALQRSNSLAYVRTAIINRSIDLARKSIRDVRPREQSRDAVAPYVVRAEAEMLARSLPKQTLRVLAAHAEHGTDAHNQLGLTRSTYRRLLVSEIATARGIL